MPGNTCPPTLLFKGLLTVAHRVKLNSNFTVLYLLWGQGLELLRDADRLLMVHLRAEAQMKSPFRLQRRVGELPGTLTKVRSYLRLTERNLSSKESMLV